MAQPASGAALIVERAVLVGTSGNRKTLYVQDEGGGAYSGIAVFCNFSSTRNPCPITETEIKTFKRGDVLTVMGTFDVFTPPAPPGAAPQLEIKPTSIIKLGTAAPVAVAAAAADLAKDATGASNEQWRGVYLHMVGGGPFAVSNLEPPELMNSNPPAPMCANGPRYGGFEVTAGSAHLLIATSFYRSIKLANDPACAFAGDCLVTDSTTFSALGGVYDVSFGAQQLMPVIDDDYATTTCIPVADGGLPADAGATPDGGGASDAAAPSG
jgi:hypothetical protein